MNQEILLVEDNPHDEILTCRSLKKCGVLNHVIVAHDGAEALDYLFCTGMYADRDPDQTPALVLLDLNLPKISGLDVLKRIRADETMKMLPIVILTSSDEDKDRLEGYVSGANSYVRKPVEFNEFASAVQQLSMYWLLLNRPPPFEKKTAKA